jgi:hypothetical protein
MKHIVVCGDSFNVDDIDYPNIHWTTKLNNFKLTNLSIPGASNLVIRLQLDKAIELEPDLIVVSFTSSMRTIVKYNKQINSNLLDRIYHAPHNKNEFDLISFPYAGAELYNVLTANQLSILKDYVSEFVDLDLLRSENYFIIKDALETLVQSKIKFNFSLGGFDHQSFTTQTNFNFSKFIQHQCPINLWDHCSAKKQLRPWYHVADINIHSNLAEYYKCLIK